MGTNMFAKPKWSTKIFVSYVKLRFVSVKVTYMDENGEISDSSLF